MAAQENSIAKQAAGKGSLDGLAQRLGALEESLTVVAGELGVSSVPKFKRLDPDSVYREAIRQAQQAVEPLRLALRNLEGRLEEIARTQAQIKRQIAADRDSHARTESVAAIDAQLAALAARLDIVCDRLDAQANAANAKAQSSAAPQIDPALIAAEIARQIQSLVRDATAQPDPLPLMADSPVDRSRDLNPLVMGATERAIVRLTHRLEKLEERHHRANSDARSKGKLMGRLFES